MLKAILTEPLYEPVSLAEAKAHLNLDHNEDDNQVATMITAARRMIEARCNRVLVRQQWRLYFDRYLADFKLAPATVQEVGTIYYTDVDGVTQSVDPSVYEVDIPRQCVFAAYGEVWPSTRYAENIAWVDVWAGYYKTGVSPIDVRGNVPEDIKQATLMAVEDMYEHRGRNSEMELSRNDTFDILTQFHVVYE